MRRPNACVGRCFDKVERPGSFWDSTTSTSWLANPLKTVVFWRGCLGARVQANGSREDFRGSGVSPRMPKGERGERRLVPKPRWLIRFEAALALAIPVHPHVLSAAKLLLLTPLFYLGLSGTVPALSSAWVLTSAFLVFAALDYLDG